MEQLQEKSWLGKVLATVLSIFISNWEQFAEKLWGKVPDPLQDKVNITISIVERLKSIVDGPGADFITSLIPGDLDDKLKLWLRANLPVILEKAKVVTGQPLTFGQKVEVAAKITAGITGMDEEQAVITNVGGYKAYKLAQAA